MKLLVSEMFYSQQSEGISTGVPAFFLRLAKCNLLCGGLKGELVKAGKATWFCDTIPVWKQGTEKTYEEIHNEFENNGIVSWLNEGRCHLVISGGEPTMDIHQEKIVGFLNWYKEKHPLSNLFVEIETNGTNCIIPELFDQLSQINCSPKLSNSGMSKKVRIVDRALLQIKQHKNHQFKFVINTEDNMKECIDDFITPFSLTWNEIVLMPGVDMLEELSSATRTVFEIGKKYGYRAITRSHILAWDQTTGV